MDIPSFLTTYGGPIAWTGGVMTPKRIFALIMGALALARGYGYITPDKVPDGLYTLSLVPGGLGTWGWAWALCGAVIIIGAFTRHQNTTIIPFVLINLLWGGSYLIQWFGEAIVHGTDNRNWITCLSYFGLAAAVLTVIRLVDPEEVRTRSREDR